MPKKLWLTSLARWPWGLTLLVLAACAALPPTPPAELREPGPYSVRLADPVVVRDPVQDRDVSLRVVYPDGEGVFPVVVFSHGAFCYPQLYASVTDHWVSHGYVVILPNHVDSPNGGKLNPTVLTSLLSSRVRDMSFVVDALDQVEASVPGLEGRIDRERIAAAGHSLGGMITMIKVGLLLEDPQTGFAPDYSDDRFVAAVVMSGVGPTTMMDGTVLTEDAFNQLRRPLFASGGTLDEGNIGSGETFPWQWRMSGYTLAPPGDKYYLVLENADHYLGGLICRENRGGKADSEAMQIVRMASIAFLNAYLKDDAAAKRFLQDTDFTRLTAGRAELQFK